MSNETVKKELSKGPTYKCEVCDKYYASYKSYGNHVRSYHSKNKEKAKCPHCGNCFTRRDNLQQHIKLFHGTKDCKFQCRYCDNTFQTKHSCTKHQKSCYQKPLDDFGTKLYDNKNSRNRSIDTHVKKNNSTELELVPPEKFKSDSKTIYKDSSDACTHRFSVLNVNTTCKCCERKESKNIVAKNVVPFRRNTNSVEGSIYNRDNVSRNIKHKYEADCYDRMDANQDSFDYYPRTRRARRDSLTEIMQEGDEYPYALDKQSKQTFWKNDFETVRIDTGDRPSKTDFKSYNSPQAIEHVSLENVNYLKEVDKMEDNIDRALDCMSCNITFLTKQDYDSHKPFCHEMAF